MPGWMEKTRRPGYSKEFWSVQLEIRRDSTAICTFGQILAYIDQGELAGGIGGAAALR